MSYLVPKEFPSSNKSQHRNGHHATSSNNKIRNYNNFMEKMKVASSASKHDMVIPKSSGTNDFDNQMFIKDSYV